MRERKYIKLRVDMYEDTKFKIIDTMEERDLIHYIWARILTLAGKVNLEGDLYMSKNIPYTAETLSIEFNRSVEKVELALNVLKDLEMMEFTEDNTYKIRNFVKHQNIKVKEKTENVGDKGEVKNKESIVNEELENEKESKDNKGNIVENNCTKDNKIDVNTTAKEIKCENELENEMKIIKLKNDQSENNYLNNKNIYNKEKSDNNIALDSNLLLDKRRNKRKSNNDKKKEKYNNDIIKIDDDHECMMEICEWSDEPKIEGDILIKSFSF